MRPSQILRGGGEKLPGKYMGTWGALGGTPQKGITSYAMSANRQKPMAGVAHAAVFNVARRTRGQILYFAPPFIAVYFLLQWAEERNHFLNSKAGRRLMEGEATSSAGVEGQTRG